MTSRAAQAATTHPDDTDHPSLGTRVRRARHARGWNLAELSRRSGIAVSTLSKVENDRLSLTYDRLMQVAHGFGQSLSEFLGSAALGRPAAAAPGRRSIARAGDVERVETPNYVYNYLCTDLVSKKLVPNICEVRARSLQEFGPLLRHPGEEFVHVLTGTVVVHTEHYGPTLLRAGESAYIDSTMGHAYLNGGEEPATMLAVNTNPGPKADQPNS